LNIDDFILEIADAVNALDREKAIELCDTLKSKIERYTQEISSDHVCKVLNTLRQKRFFWLMEGVATTYLKSIPDDKQPAKVRRQLIQAIIDQGQLMNAEDELLDLIELVPIDQHEGTEARGLLGRVHKQAYVNARQSGTKAGIQRLRKAINAYLPVYEYNPEEYWWHGINVVACLARAERDGISKKDLLDSDIDWKDEAKKILDRVKTYSNVSDDYTWATATAMEACVALERMEEANRWCERYIKAPYADVFELGATERQLREVWNLDERDVPGSEVLRIIQGHLGQLGGSLNFSGSARSLLPCSKLKYQAQLGSESTRAVKWMDNLCNRANSVAKISKDIDDTASGTGFFVKAQDLGGSWDESYVLVTNAHVVNMTGYNGAIRADRARVQITRVLPNVSFEIQKIWSNKELDTSICVVKIPEEIYRPANQGQQNVSFGIPFGRTNDLKQIDRNSKPRLYVIGHPHGAALQISLYDNHLIDFSEREERIRYRSPTEEGSSGSPVLSEGLEVVAVHHATLTDREANQGVLLDNIRTRIRSGGAPLRSVRR
jgi:hypothetical protein